MEKQKEEIQRSDKLAQEIRQEVYILQREVKNTILVFVGFNEF